PAHQHPIAHRTESDPAEALQEPGRMSVANEQGDVLCGHRALRGCPVPQPAAPSLDDLVGALEVAESRCGAVEQRETTSVDAEQHFARVEAMSENCRDVYSDPTRGRKRRVTVEPHAAEIGGIGEERERRPRV